MLISALQLFTIMVNFIDSYFLTWGDAIAHIRGRFVYKIDKFPHSL